MQHAVLLKCPICDAVQALEGRRREYSKEDLSLTSGAHLRDHDLDETKRAIQKCKIAVNSVEIVSHSDDHQIPMGEWKERTDTWLPEGALSGGDTSPPASGSSIKETSL